MENILLVFGGRSYEHDISVVTASQIYNRTRLEDCKLIPVYITRDNKFYIYLRKQFALEDFSSEKVLNNRKVFKEVSFVVGEAGKIFVKSFFGLREYLNVYLAIVALHGGSGEDGRITSLLEFYGINCSAGNFDSLAVCMNKFLFKQMMIGLKIPVVRGFKIDKYEYEKNKDLILSKVKKLQFPVVLKVNSGGSSIGVFVAKNLDEFETMINQAFEFDNVILIEKQVKNCREFNVAIMGNLGNYIISEVDEPIKSDEILSFADKYVSNEKNLKVSKVSSVNNLTMNIKRNFPANIPIKISDKIKYFAEKICNELDLKGVIRIDFLYDQSHDKIYVCEVNAIPGSLAYYFFNNNSILLNDFVLKLIEISKNKKEIFNDSFVTNILK